MECHRPSRNRLAEACRRAGYEAVIPATWGDELVATARMSAAMRARPHEPGIGGDQAGFGWAGHDLNVDVVLAGKEETLPDWEVGESLALLFSEFEHIRQYIDGFDLAGSTVVDVGASVDEVVVAPGSEGLKAVIAAFVGVMIVAASFFLGMMIAVVTSRPLW